MDEQQFWGRVKPQPGDDACWLWIGSRCEARGGYGIVYFQKKMWRAHRLAWFLTHGSIPPSKYILHSCDNPPCVNPDHLRPGTQSDNMLDMHKRGRHPSPGQPGGERHAMAKLSESGVRAIHQRLQDGAQQTDLADEYDVTLATVAAIAQGRSWQTLGLQPLQRRHGAQKPGSKLTDEKVLEILQLLRNGATIKDVAASFGVGRTIVHSILHGQKWKHVPRD